MKQCSKCGATKELSVFKRDKSRLSGLSSWCKDCHNFASKLRYLTQSKEQINLYAKQYRTTSLKYKEYQASIRAKENIRKNDYKKVNLDKHAANEAKRRAAKLQRTPKWLTPEQIKDIQQFYIEAKELSWLSLEPLEVDHIIPLQGVNVSGLHVPWNLQILPKSINCSKSNKIQKVG